MVRQFPSAKIKELSNQDHLSSKISFKNEGQGFPDSSVVKNPLANAGDMGWISDLGKIPHALEQLSLRATATEPML